MLTGIFIALAGVFLGWKFPSENVQWTAACIIILGVALAIYGALFENKD